MKWLYKIRSEKQSFPQSDLVEDVITTQTNFVGLMNGTP